ncbi:MAG: transcriptional repressor [Planctomycetota bacterium]
MKLQPNTPRSVDDDHESELPELDIIEPLCAVFRRHLKNDGQKYTPERAHILDTIIELDGVFEVETLLARVRDTGFRVSKATIYRTLKLLEDAGIVELVPFDREQSHYQLVYGRRPDAILVNVDSGAIKSVELAEIMSICERVCGEHGLTLEGHRLQIFAREQRNASG